MGLEAEAKLEFLNHEHPCNGFLVSLESFKRFLSVLKTLKSKHYLTIDSNIIYIQWNLYNYHNGRTICHRFLRSQNISRDTKIILIKCKYY